MTQLCELFHEFSTYSIANQVYAMFMFLQVERKSIELKCTWFKMLKKVYMMT